MSIDVDQYPGWIIISTRSSKWWERIDGFGGRLTVSRGERLAVPWLDVDFRCHRKYKGEDEVYRID